jgi:hypothetical protein
MAITPPLDPNDDDLNWLANDLATKLASAFGYPLPQAEEHIRKYYLEYERAAPLRRQVLRDHGAPEERAWTAKEVFGHDYSSLVLEIGYRLAGGDVRSEEFFEWRKTCWDALKNDQRVPPPRI